MGRACVRACVDVRERVGTVLKAQKHALPPRTPNAILGNPDLPAHVSAGRSRSAWKKKDPGLSSATYQLCDSQPIT